MAEKSGIEQIEECIDVLVTKFKSCPRYFFTEFDIRSYLYHLLVSKDRFKQEYVTGSG